MFFSVCTCITILNFHQLSEEEVGDYTVFFTDDFWSLVMPMIYVDDDVDWNYKKKQKQKQKNKKISRRKRSISSKLECMDTPMYRYIGKGPTQ